jgi:hypothetical protein
MEKTSFDPRKRAVLARPATQLCILVVGLISAATVWIWVGSKIVAPQLLCDEFIYANVAENIATEGRFGLRDGPWNSNFLYPALIAPAWAGSSMEMTFDLAKGINVALLILAALIVYLWARRLVSSVWALVATGLALLIPHALYTTLLLTENGLYPAFLVATFGIALALERPTLARQLLVLAAIALASAVRLQALILLPILVTAVAIKAGFDLRARGEKSRRDSLLASIKPFWPTPAILSLGAIVYLAATVARGWSLGSGFGAYESALDADYSFSEAARWTRLHLADLALLIGVVPLSALIVLAWLAASGRRHPDVAERAFLAVTLAAVPWTLAEAGIFASRFTGGITERYTFYLAPLLILAFVLWLARGLPRPPLPTALALVAALLLVESLSVERFLGPFDLPNSPTLYALFRFDAERPVGWPGIEWLVLAGAGVLALAFAFLPRRAAATLLPLGLAAFFVFSSIRVLDGLRFQATSVRAVAGSEASWIDAKLSPDDEAAFFFTPMGDVWESSTLMLQAEFWNERIAAIYNLGIPELCPLPERSAAIDLSSGRIVAKASEQTVLLTPSPAYVVTDRRLELEGRVVAEQGALVLYELEPPARAVGLTEGVFLDGWIGAAGAFSRYAPAERGEEIAIFLARPGPTRREPGVAKITMGTLATGPDGQPRIGRVIARRRWEMGTVQGKLIVLPAPRSAFRIEIQVEPTFPAAAYVPEDARQLGVKASFRFLPG